MTAQNAGALMYDSSHAGLQEQTTYLNMTCESGVYLLPRLCACVCAE